MPIRMCAACRGRFEKRELIRIVETADGGIRVDKAQKAQCRGLYICGGCLPDARRKKVLERNFRRRIEPEVYDRLRAEAPGNG